MRIFPFQKAVTTEKETTVIDEIVQIQKGDENKRNEFIDKYKNFILSVTSRFRGKYIEIENDEEYSVALIGFNKAIDSFDAAKNDAFFPFATLLIKRALIDYVRKIKKNEEIQFSQLAVDHEKGEVNVEEHIARQSLQQQTDQVNLAQEITIFKVLLEEFSICFDELVKVCPKHIATRKKVTKIVKTVLHDELLKSEVLKKKRLPIARISSMTNVSKKTLERHRKYIMATFVLLDSDLYYIREYIRDIL